MIHDLYSEKAVIVCGDFNFHLDGTLEDWPELEGIDNLKRIGLADTYRMLYPDAAAHPGFTEDTDENFLRWNQKLLEKKLRYDAILYRGEQWKPVQSELIGTNREQLSKGRTSWFLDNFSTARAKGREGNLKGYNRVQNQIEINASDHFGVLTTFKAPAKGGTRRRRQRRQRTRRVQLR
jgi:hypothetical protein